MRYARLAIIAAAAIVFWTSAAFPLASEEPKASGAKPTRSVVEVLDGLAVKPGELRTLDAAETLSLFGAGAVEGLNVFELLDAVHRWALSARVRVSFPGGGLHEAARVYDMGRERVRALLPLDLVTSLEIGAIISPGQAALAADLAEPYSEFVEIGTIKLSRSFGFGALEPHRFLEPYGIVVARFPIVAPLDRLELYAPQKGAIYVSGAPKPKRWNLWPITKR